jgi:hypothetical protein
MMGQIDEWLFRTLSGIRQQTGTHGMRHLIINPKVVGDIRNIKTSIQTLYGRVKVEFNLGSSLPSYRIPGGCTFVSE